MLLGVLKKMTLSDFQRPIECYIKNLAKIPLFRSLRVFVRCRTTYFLNKRNNPLGNKLSYKI